MQHEPDYVRFVQAYLDKVIAGAERTEVNCVVTAIELRVFREDRVVARLEFEAPDRAVPP